MRKISRIALVAILLTVSSAGISQTISDSFYLQMTHIFQHVDTTKVTTGLFKDYGMDVKFKILYVLDSIKVQY